MSSKIRMADFVLSQSFREFNEVPPRPLPLESQNPLMHFDRVYLQDVLSKVLRELLRRDTQERETVFSESNAELHKLAYSLSEIIRAKSLEGDH